MTRLPVVRDTYPCVQELDGTIMLSMVWAVCARPNMVSLITPPASCTHTDPRKDCSRGTSMSSPRAHHLDPTDGSSSEPTSIALENARCIADAFGASIFGTSSCRARPPDHADNPHSNRSSSSRRNVCILPISRRRDQVGESPSRGSWRDDAGDHPSLSIPSPEEIPRLVWELQWWIRQSSAPFSTYRYPISSPAATTSLFVGISQSSTPVWLLHSTPSSPVE